MKGSKIVFICSECGAKSPKWLGKCPDCGAWNTYEEEVITETKSKSSKNINTKNKFFGPPSLKNKTMIEGITYCINELNQEISK